jgi:hypothetical protein
MDTVTFGVSPISNAFPMNYTSTGNFFTNWTPANLNSLSGNITEWGWEYGSAFTAKSWGNIKIWFGETTNSALTTTANATLLANFNVGTPVLCYDGPMT